MELWGYFQNYFSSLHEQHGINITILYDAWDARAYARGILMTVFLAVASIILSSMVGVLFSWLQMSRRAVLRGVSYVYVQFFRNTPPLAQLYFFYFGLGAVLPKYQTASGVMSPLFNNVEWAIISLSLFAGAFNTEIFRSGIEAVPVSTVEAAQSLGYSRWGAFVHVIFPLAFRICLPALTNNLVNLVKTTAIAYAIAVPEVLYVSNQLWSDNFNVVEMMNVVLVTYLALVGLFVLVFQRLERKLQVPGYMK
jgi:polar amino acid transport system permease protein